MASRLFLPAGLLLVAAACARATLGEAVVDAHGGTSPTAELDFWDGVAVQRAVTNDDALHALLLSFGGAREAGDYAARLEAARARGWLDAGHAPPRTETARVGWIAKAVVIETGLKGGLTLRVFGPSERYAVRELNHLGWLPEMSRHQALSGARLIAVLSKAEDHRTGSGRAPGEGS